MKMDHSPFLSSDEHQKIFVYDYLGQPQLTQQCAAPTIERKLLNVGAPGTKFAPPQIREQELHIEDETNRGAKASH